jgi:hypothetical protein
MKAQTIKKKKDTVGSLMMLEPLKPQLPNMLLIINFITLLITKAPMAQNLTKLVSKTPNLVEKCLTIKAWMQ